MLAPRRPACLLAALLALLCAGCGSEDDDAASDLSIDCEGASTSSAAFEERVLELTNQARASGHDCGEKGAYAPAAPLAANEALRCAARTHSAYMARTGEFSHGESANGSGPFDRIRSAGYRFSAAGENIAFGQRSAEEVVSGWLDSDGHCANIMDPAFRELGVGYALGASQAAYWTQTFGAPQ